MTCNNEEGDFIDVMVVGSGLSGGTAAFYLNRKGVRVMLAEARDQAGGNLITKQGDDRKEQTLHCQLNGPLG